ncbi:HNH endonuclease [Corynebacterium poyangense]|uniref:HNH endonuclease n=1 Tax=Corynebacterium poyangense TaxID=2684405 RepID=A0A7H0SQP6_9CORY|nr:HNH endonuclease signature motif containing protein [Corynebacterium poyangense]QNQ90871.1 HNH endonuclease [Corynebacterium poyangense]
MGPRWGGTRATRLTALTLATYGDRCHLCGKHGATTADHLVPRSRGGDDAIENLRPAHVACNSMRGSMPIEEWRRKHPIYEQKCSASRKW